MYYNLKYGLFKELRQNCGRKFLFFDNFKDFIPVHF